MSVFNGARYLEQQLLSLENQTFKRWKLVVRDNGSSDSTLQLLRNFASKQNKGKVKIIHEHVNIAQVYNSFIELVVNVKTRYCMFCDGDDFWLPSKIASAIEEIKVLEDKYGEDAVLLCHTDLVLTDENLTPTSLSMWASQKLNPARKNPIQCLMHSSAVGNTFIFNQSLVKKLYNRPSDLIMHDIYCSTIASIYGQISYSKKSHILYRQHSNNFCGGESFYSFQNFLAKLKPKQIREAVNRKSLLAEGILLLHGKNMVEADRNAFSQVARIRRMNWLMRKLAIFKAKAYLNGFLRNMGLFLFG